MVKLILRANILPNNTNIKKTNFSKTEVGIRPEFIKFSNDGIKVKN
jgi:glycerol transport system ATP-binding protein